MHYPHHEFAEIVRCKIKAMAYSVNGILNMTILDIKLKKILLLYQVNDGISYNNIKGIIIVR